VLRFVLFVVLRDLGVADRGLGLVKLLNQFLNHHLLGGVDYLRLVLKTSAASLFDQKLHPDEVLHVLLALLGRLVSRPDERAHLRESLVELLDGNRIIVEGSDRGALAVLVVLEIHRFVTAAALAAGDANSDRKNQQSYAS